jgi:hypothetical protein
LPRAGSPAEQAIVVVLSPQSAIRKAAELVELRSITTPARRDG